MRQILLRAGITSVSLLWLCSAAFADYASGLKAYEAKDYVGAFREWLAAADSGEIKSQFELAKLYDQGLGVLRNRVEADRWYSLAAAGGIAEATQARDAVEAKMTPSEIAQAQKLASAWRPAAGSAPASDPAAPQTGSGPPPPAPTQSAVPHFNAGLAALKANKPDEAIAEFTAGLAVMPNAPASYYLGESYRMKGQNDQAAKAYGDSLALDPNSKVAELARKAQASLQTAAEAPPGKEQTVAAQRMLMALGYQIGSADGMAGPRTAAAVTAFEKKSGLPEDGKLTGPLLIALKNEIVKATAQAQPSLSAGFDALKAKDYAKSIAQFRSGLAIKDDAVGEYYLGQAYKATGDNQAALDHIRRSLALDSTSPVAPKAAQEARELAALLSPPPPAAEAEPAQQPPAGAAPSPAIASIRFPEGVWRTSFEKRFESGIEHLTDTLTFNSKFSATIEEESTKTVSAGYRFTGCGNNVRQRTLITRQDFTMTSDQDSIGFDKIEESAVIKYSNPPCAAPSKPFLWSPISLEWDGTNLKDAWDKIWYRIK